MAVRKPYSETPAQALPGRLITLEGMPGAGKTAAGSALAAEGRTVLGEYVTAAGAAVPVTEHPDVADDAAHQANWLAKAAHATAALRFGAVVFCDRDWLSALSYAYSLADQDGGRMLAARAEWAQAQLGTGRLRPADAYVLFDLSPAHSMARRADRLNRRHPWSQAAALCRLRDFYAHPAAALTACPGLAARIKDAAWHRVCGLDPLPAALRFLHDLADPPRASGASEPCR
jgi:thymidylate kinase